MWLVRRAERLGDPWSGHLAFPGGRWQEGDGDLLRTAMRETWEEVGVDLSDAELLGGLDDLAARPLRSLMLRPFVFRVDHAPTFRLNHEVAAVHRCEIDALLAGRGRGVMRWPLDAVGVKLPCVDVDGARLWGLTLAVIDDLLHRLDGRGVGLARPTL
jgi:8-oxo-dGTP pyrophosphatase MutT (NUDIX family)